MLGKLIKYDFRSIGKSVILLNVFILIITLLGNLMFLMRIWETESVFIITLGIASGIFYYLSIIGVFFAITIFVTIRFYKNIYGDEGYLMHTLAVTPRQLLLSKHIVSGLSLATTSIIVFISVLSLLISFILSTGASFSDIINTLLFEIKPSFDLMMTELNISGFEFFMFTLFLIFSLLFFNSSLLFTSISLGQLFSKHKVLGSVLCYFGHYVVLQVIVFVLFIPLTISSSLHFSTTQQGFSIFKNFYWIMFIGYTVYIVGSFFLSEYLMKKKLNLD